ncbi:MAG: hypothetical protein Q9207_008068 [Kuettlingeria erythrocarpa]
MIASSLSNVAFSALVALSSIPLGNAFPTSSLISARTPGGINKEGSSQCVFQYVGTMPELQFKVDKIDVNTVFKAGEKIACASYDDICLAVNKPKFGDSCSGICASLCENTPEATVGASTKSDDAERNELSPTKKNTFGDVIGDLRWFGAQNCGTAPLNRTINDNSLGCITVNYVTDVCNVNPDTPCRMTNGQTPEPHAVY